MHDLIYDQGRVVAHINLGSLVIEKTNVNVPTVSGGKLFSSAGRLLGLVRTVTNPSPEKSPSRAFRKVLDREA